MKHERQSKPFSTLSDDELLQRLSELLQKSRRAESELVAHIGEVDARRLYAREAAPSMFAYCTEVLHLSEPEAYLRISVARAARAHPMLLEMLADGRLHLSGIAKLAPYLTETNREAVLARAAGKSKREIEELVAEIAPKPDVPATIRKLPPRKVESAPPLEQHPKELRSNFLDTSEPATPTPPNRGDGRGPPWGEGWDEGPLEPILLAESARSPFFSPDGQWVGFRETPSGPWVRVAVTGGPAVPIGGGGGTGSRDATWGPDDTIVFAINDTSTGLSRISAAGGEAEVLTTPDPEKGETDHLFPEFLPGGSAVLFTISNDQGLDNSQIAVLDLDTREYRILIQGGSHARYAGSGHIVYGVAGTRRAVPFDLSSLEVRGTPTPVVDGVMTQRTGTASFSVASDGTLAYVAGSAISALRTPLWVDRDGREESIPAEPRGYEYLRIAHDGQRVAFDECNLGGDIG